VEIARDRDFRNVIYRKTVLSEAQRDFTVHHPAFHRVLRPGERYWYRFFTCDRDSPVGTFMTARPADSREPVRIGFFSCQDYQAGFYTAHAGLAAEPDLDLVVCLGDYIYERTFYPGPAERRDTTGVNRDADVQTLPEYRQKYALYRSDPQLQAMHAAHPVLAIVDDHEIEDNWARDEPGEATGGEGNPARRVPFLERRRAGYDAFFEWMPKIRNAQEPDRTYGSLRLGANAEVFLLDTRRYRDDQPCNDAFVTPCPDSEAEGRTLLGPGQKAWLKEAVSSSRARWKVVANQIMIMSLDSAPGTSVNQDQWDGYGAERREVLGHFLERGVQDLTFITGDIHTFFAGQVHVNGRVTTPAVGTEFVGGSITSLGFENIFGQGTLATEPGIRANNPHYAYSNQTRRGYAVLEARPDELLVTYRAPRTTQQARSPIDAIGRFRVAAGRPAVEVL
jgi:alkaline phosphatase D